MSDLTLWIESLSSARQELAEVQAECQALKDELESTPEWKRYQDRLAYSKNVQAYVDEATERVRESALREFAESGDKKPAKGVQVKLFSKLVYDAAQALDYAKANLPAALKLDTKKFEAAAKALDLPFVATEEEPRVYIDAVLEVGE